MTKAVEHVPFNRPYAVGDEARFIAQALEHAHLSCDGPFTQLCQRWLERDTGCSKALLMHSCTAALEAAAILTGAEPGDEVILPSYTFVSTAGAFVLRGVVPVFVDVRADTMNIDERLIEAAITPRTRAVVAVHYGGVGCDMDAIMKIAAAHDLMVVEDAAQGVLASRDGRALGAIGDIGTISFHETKNVTCGEGGAILLNDESLTDRAEILRQKGTDRRRFDRGLVDKYTWVDLGSSYGLSDLNAAFLWAQLRHAEDITRSRLDVWDRYHDAFARHEEAGIVRRPTIPAGCVHNAHLYYLILPPRVRARFISELSERGVNAVFHYVPLHSSPAGRRYGRAHGTLAVTQDLSARLVRLPLWAHMPDEAVERVVDAVDAALGIVVPDAVRASTS